MFDYVKSFYILTKSQTEFPNLDYITKISFKHLRIIHFAGLKKVTL